MMIGMLTLVFMLLRRGPSMSYIPDDVPRNLEALQFFVKNMAEDETLHHEDLKTH